MKSTEIRIDVECKPASAWSTENSREVQITHLPSGTVVSSKSERSQYANKEKCIKMLEALFGPLEIVDARENERQFREAFQLFQERVNRAFTDQSGETIFVRMDKRGIDQFFESCRTFLETLQ